MNKNFAENLKKIRKEHNLSQEQLAEELGVSRQAISKWESSQAYPEMDKIIFLCEKFNLNIDDLLYRDIKEVKGEEETKKKWNIYTEEFFKYAADSVSLFSRMKFTSKIKFIFEEILIALVLYIFFSICHGLLFKITGGFFDFLVPFKIFDGVRTYLDGIYSVATFIIGLIIMVKIYKQRYLDYFNEENGHKEKLTVEENKDSKEEKIELKKENKVIIRDRNDSDYSIFKLIGKIIIIGLKIGALWITFSLCAGLLFIGIGIVLSFLVSNSGIFFMGLLLSLISAAITDIVIILVFMNFIFNRKNAKRPMIWAFIISIIVIGLGIGMMFIGTLDFKLVNDNSEYITNHQEIDMKDNFFFDRDDIEYIFEDRNNIRIEYQILSNRNFFIKENQNGMININVYNDNELEEMQKLLKGFNKKQILNRGNSINKITVYTSNENIDKLINNKKSYIERIDKQRDEIERLEEELKEKEDEIEDLESKLNNQEYYE